MAKMVSVHISERKGERKHLVAGIQRKYRRGIAGDDIEIPEDRT